jgi:quinol monooxygenase YgiN
MLVNYVTFEVDTDDRAGFDTWYGKLVDDAKSEHGCIIYDYLTYADSPTKGAILAAWETQEDIAAHRLHPSHIEILALATSKWGMHNIRIQSFSDIGGYKTAERDRMDGSGEPPDVRDTILELIARFHASGSAS